MAGHERDYDGVLALRKGNEGMELAGLEPATSWVRSRFRRAWPFHGPSSHFTNHRISRVFRLRAEPTSLRFADYRAPSVSETCHFELSDSSTKPNLPLSS